MIDKIFDQIVVKVKYDGAEGSGVIMQPVTDEHSYLISAWHCVKSEKTIKLDLLSFCSQIEGKLEEITIGVQDYIIDEENDIVVFKIDYCDAPRCKVINTSLKEDVFIVGFPKALNNSAAELNRYPLSGQVNSLPTQNIIQIDSNRALETYYDSAKEVVSSYSGSGIFCCDDKGVSLCGIITSLGSENGAFGILNGILQSRIQQLLECKNWNPLSSLEHCSFDDYKEGMIEVFDSPLNIICSTQMPAIRKSVKPYQIIQKCGRKLVWPYSTKQLGHDEIWESWLLYLILRSIENSDNLNEEKYYFAGKHPNVRRIKLIYVTNKIKINEFLKEYVVDAFGDINPNDMIIVKTDKTPFTTALPSGKTEKIVTDISNTICLQNEMRIDDVKSNSKGIAVIHIQALVDEIKELIKEIEEREEEITEQELEKRIGIRVEAVLNAN